MTDQQIARRRRRDQELLSELEQTESRIEATRARTEQAMNEARERLEAIEAQAGEAEERATRAERLAQLREQEAERERRLHEMLERINEAERRARDAENRARHAVAEVAKPIDSGTTPPEMLPPEPDPESLSGTAAEAPAPGGVLPGSPADHGEDATSGPSVVPDFENEGASERPGVGFGGGESEPQAPPPPPPMPASGPVNLNDASFEELRNAGLSVTQTGRVLAHRERGGGFSSVDELDEIPGFPREFLDQVKPNLTA